MQPSVQPQEASPTFFHMGLAPKMLEILDRMKIVVPTPVQLKSIPIGMEGKDIVGIAQTGTGKTLAFGIPLTQRLNAAPGGRGVVLVPTRELALQVHAVLQKVLQPFGMNSIVLIGGAPMGPQIKFLQKHPRVIIATPGRLNDHLRQNTVQLKDVQIMVLDEADRMLDMGFLPQVEQILRHVPKVRQTMLFSATMPSDILNLAGRHMKLPIHIEIAPSGTSAEHVAQELYILKEELKEKLLLRLLEQYRGSILLFARTKIRAKRLRRTLREKGVNAAEIHSDRSMDQRKKAMEGFKSGQFRLLVATDIAARGIDVTGIELVINYDLPDDIENYVHRIGRTGRAGREGRAITFATPEQSDDIAKIERLIKKSLSLVQHPDIPVGEFRRPAQKPSFGGLNRRTIRSFRPRRRW